jgi:regulator of protease activity HflC (stomatin/prohibitin superfamily)
MALVYTVPQAHCCVVERFGKFSRIQKEGLHFMLPMVERLRRVDSWGPVANRDGYLIELSEQQTDTPARQCHTKDNVEVSSNASLYWRIFDPVKAVYEVDELPRSVSDIALNALRANIGKMDLDELLAERQQLNEQIASQLSDSGRKWGVQFTRVEIQELRTTDETAKAMRQQMEAERKRRAAVAEAEGEAAAELKVAEAEKQAAVMRAEGRAKALKLIAEAEATYLEKLKEQTTPDAAAQIVIAQKFMDGFERITKNPSDKVFLPNNYSALFSIPTDAAPKN